MIRVVAEDSYITFRFAKNLAHGYGFVWNIGEPPIEGYTNFLWLLICAFVYKIGLPLPVTSQILGICASIGTLYFTFKFANRIFKVDKIFALVPLAFLAFTGPFVHWTMSGMETVFFGFLLITGVYHFALYLDEKKFPNIFIAALVLFLATLTRPEGFIIFGILCGIGFLRWAIHRNYSFLHLLLFGVTYLIPFGVYLLWKYTYFGDILPNTYYAKTGGGIYQCIRGCIYVGYFSFHYILPFLLVFALYLWEDLPFMKKGLGIKSFIQNFTANTGVFTATMILLVYGLYLIYTGGDYMAMYRFVVPVLPFLHLLMGLLFYLIYKKIEDQKSKRQAAIGVLIFVFFANLIHSLPIAPYLYKKSEFQHGNYLGVKIERWHTGRLRTIGKFFQSYHKSYNESLATGAIGAISYLADMKIYGMHGLVDPVIAHKKRGREKKLGLGYPGHEKGDIEYIFHEKKPTYLMFDRNLTKEPQDYPSEYSDDLLEYVIAHYKIKAVWLKDPFNHEEGYFTFLEKRDKES